MYVFTNRLHTSLGLEIRLKCAKTNKNWAKAFGRNCKTTTQIDIQSDKTDTQKKCQTLDLQLRLKN